MDKTAVSQRKPASTTMGILYMLAHALCMSAVVTTAKQLTYSLHHHQVAFLYKATVLVVILPWCALGGIKKTVRTSKIWLHIARGAFSIMGTLCFMSALAKISALDVTALTYLEPVLMTVIGIVYLKERVTWIKIMMICLSFVGAMSITIPSFLKGGNTPAINLHYLYVLLALLFWAGNNLMIKFLGKTEHTKTQLFYLMVISSVFAYFPAKEHWLPLQWWHAKYLAILAVAHMLHSICFFKALRADVSVVMPFDYTRLLFTGVMSMLFLGEVPKSHSLIGYALIIIGGTIFVRYEALLGRVKKQKLQELESEYEGI